MASFNVNGKAVTVEVDDSTPLLWALRDSLELAGTRYGCGIAPVRRLHGAPGRPGRSKLRDAGVGGGRPIGDHDRADREGRIGAAVQAAWVENDVPQCGYCQSGQVMSAVALLQRNAAPADADIDAAMTGNICRCGTYGRIRAAIKSAADRLA